MFKKIVCTFLLTFIVYSNTFSQTSSIPVTLKLGTNKRSVTEFYWKGMYQDLNLMNYNRALGEVEVKYNNVKRRIIDDGVGILNVVSTKTDNIQLLFNLPGNLDLKETFKYVDGCMYWDLEFINKSSVEIVLQDLSVAFPFARLEGLEKGIPPQEILSPHSSITGNPSFCYWLPVRGDGNIMLMTMQGNTAFEFFESYFTRMYMHSSTSVNRTTDSWRMPSTTGVLSAGETRKYGFKFQLVPNDDALRERIYEEGGLDVRVIPGMTIPNNVDAKCSFRTKEIIQSVSAQFPATTTITSLGKNGNYYLYNIKLNTLGENTITVKYGNGKVGYFDFFVTEPTEILIKKRSKFITEKQQIKDPSKWYDGLYSLWNVEKDRCLSPDYVEGVQYPFFVGGSDDPSNGKPLYISEKNTVYPDQKEIAALEYYEKEFVWGGLQRTDKETPYPYGIYGIPNWYELRSGKLGGYNSGGDGLERMWRTFDYTTHFATYYNLYRIARDYPTMVKYLDANGYLDRAYNTAMAYFQVTYSILMGKQWLFNGYCDWAYKLGNVHERYIMPLIIELEKNGETVKANALRAEWEKKVKFMLYDDDEWSFVGSEGALDRTAFETTYYVCEYAKEKSLTPDSKLWYDKNKNIWYSHPVISDEVTNKYLKKQFKANFALRRIIEPGYNMLGSYTLWYNLDYMTQLGGAALCDYAVKFSDSPSKYLNLGYNSMLGGWALMNTGPNGVGYWISNPNDDGYAGWLQNPWQADGFMTKRGISNVCAEVEHGLSGAIHSVTTYIVNDAVFGIVSYGGNLTIDSDKLKVVPQDGVRRRVVALLGNRAFHIELKQDGFKQDEAVEFSQDLAYSKFYVENRGSLPHQTTILLNKLKKGDYSFKVNGNLQNNFQINTQSKNAELTFSLRENSAMIEITRTNDAPSQNAVAGSAVADAAFVCQGGASIISLKYYTGVIQWQDSIDGGSWKNIVNQTSETLYTGSIESKRYFRALVSNDMSDPVASNVVCIDLLTTTPVAKANVNEICSNGVVEISLSNYSGNIQWQFSNDVTDWTNIVNQISEKISVRDITKRTVYRAMLTVPNSNCIIYSNDVTINVVSNLSSGTATAVNNPIAYNSSAEIVLSGNSGNIQWQESTDGVTWSDIIGANKNILQTEKIIVPTYFRAYTSSGTCKADPTIPIKITFVLESITLNKENITLSKGQTEKLSYIIYPEGVENKSVKWDSTDRDIVSVLPNGTVTANAIGNALITITTVDSEKKASCNVIVVEDTEELSAIPNPAKDKFSINGFEGGTLVMLDSKGSEVYREIDISNEHLVITTDFPTGVYLLILKKGINRRTTKLRIVR